MTPTRIVNQAGKVNRLAEMVGGNEFPRLLGLLEKAVVEDHCRLDPGGMGAGQQATALDKIIFGHIGLPKLGDQRFFKKEATWS